MENTLNPDHRHHQLHRYRNPSGQDYMSRDSYRHLHKYHQNPCCYPYPTGSYHRHHPESHHLDSPGSYCLLKGNYHRDHQLHRYQYPLVSGFLYQGSCPLHKYLSESLDYPAHPHQCQYRDHRHHRQTSQPAQVVLLA